MKLIFYVEQNSNFVLFLNN